MMVFISLKKHVCEYILLQFSRKIIVVSYKDLRIPFKDEAQTALFKDPVRTAQ